MRYLLITLCVVGVLVVACGASENAGTEKDSPLQDAVVAAAATQEADDAKDIARLGEARELAFYPNGDFESEPENMLVTVPPVKLLNFSAVQTGDGEVEMTWDAHRYPLTVTGYKYNQDGGDWNAITGSDSSTHSHTVTGLTKDTTYTFAVRAVNGAGSTESDSRSVTIIGKPAAPDSFTAVAGDEQVWLGWRSPADFTISGYEYRQKEGTGAFGVWQKIPGIRSGTTFHIVTGLSNDTSYTFQVRAANAAGESETSGEQSATPATASSAPVKPEGFAARQTGIGHVELTRKASSNPLNVTGYEFRQDNGSWTTISGSDSRTVSHSVTGLTQGVTYACWVCAVNNFGESDPSNLWFVTIVATPQRPTGLSATAGDTQVTVDWDGPANIIPNQPINKYQLVQVPQSKLTASVPGTNDEFGYSVAIDGDTAVVGAHQHDVTPSGGGTAVANAGAAYVFTKDSEGASSQAATLTASDGAADDEFGISVAVYGETVVVGAHQHDATIGGNTVGNSGAAYVFTRPADGWADSTGTATLTASDGAENDYFGISLSLDGSTVVVGAPGSDSNMGAAYVFNWDSANSAWEQKAKLTASDGAANDEFGISVAVDGNTVVVGAKGHESNKGAAYVFTKPADGWADSTGTATLTASDGAENDYFGISLSLDGSTVVVGAPGSDSNMGAAYVFNWDSANSAWEQKAKLTASDGAANDKFGISVAVDGNSVVVGAYLDSRADDIVISSGSVYVFINRSGVWSETLNLAAPDAAPYDRFGYSVALDGGTLLAGVPQPVYFVGGTPIRRPGAAYLLEIANEDKMVVAEWVDLKPTDLTVSYVGSNLRPIYVYRVLGLDNDQEYAFRVRAVNDAGNSPSAETVAATPRLSKPGKPTGLSARAGNRRVTLSWDDPLDSSIDGYQVLKPPEQTKLTVGSDGGEKGKFGKSVAVDSGTAVVGAPEHDGTDTEGNPITDSGAAYVFTKDSSGWGQPIKLTAGSDGARNDLFGYSVAVDGDTIVVGAYQLEYQGVNNTVEKPGAAYIFTKVDGVWSQAAKLTASDGAVKDRFGYSVAVGGDTVVVGARGHNGKTGAAYVFTKVGGVWGNSLDGSETHRTETAKLTATGGATFDYFGHSVAVNRDTIVVGARGLDSSPSAAYVFTEVGGVWGQKAKLTASNADDDDQFGQSVAVDGDTVVVGAQQGDRKRGSAYVFTKPTGDNWANNTETARLAASDRGASDYLGASVAIRGSTIVVGAYAADIDREDDGALSGAAYVFTKPANVDWANDPNKDYRTESGKLTLPTDEEEKSDEFGNSVALDGQSMVVGAPEGNDGFGSVYVSDIPKWAFLASGAETTSATVRGLTNGAQYAFQVRAVEYESEGLPSDIVRATPKVSNVDEAGTVSVSLEQPEVGTALVVSLSDPDGSLSDISWQWARSSDGSDWSDIFGANSDSYTPVADDVGIYLQATASYTDGHGPGKSAHAVMERQTAQRGPSFEGDVTFTVEENTSPGTPVGDAITATDRDGDVLTYSLSGIDASSFVLDGSTGQITVGSGTLLDYESGPTRYTVVVSVHDGRGVYGDDDSTIDDLIEVSIDVSNVDEAGTVSVSLEQPEVGTALVVSLSDPDDSLSDISWQWARSSDGSDWSDIFGANSDSYTPVADDVGIYLQATASYTDGHGPGKSAHAVMERQTAQRGPSFEGDVTFTVEENTSPGTPVGDAITATDRDGDVLTYSLSGIDASSFVLDGSTGQITVGSGTLLDYESGPTRYTVVVSVHDGRGVYGDDDSTIDDLIEVSIDVSNVDEAGTVSVSLEQPEVGTALVVSLSDPDGSLSDISWQWARSSDRTDWQDMAGASSFTYTPVDRDGDKYLRVTASYADGEGSGKQAQAVLNNPVQGLPEPVATPTTTATDTPSPSPTPTPTAEPAPSEADGGEEGFPWWVIVAVVIGVVAGVVLIIVVLRSRR